MAGRVSAGHDGSAAPVTSEKCLFVGPDLARTGGAAYHVRQILRWIRTPHVTFATFGRAVPPDVAERVARVVTLEKEKWTGYPAAIARLAATFGDVGGFSSRGSLGRPRLYRNHTSVGGVQQNRLGTSLLREQLVDAPLAHPL